MVLLDQPLSPWFARSEVSELPLGHEIFLVTSTCSCVPGDTWLCFWVGLELRWDKISQFESIYSVSGPTAILHSPEHLVPQPLSDVPRAEGDGEEQSGSCGSWVHQACDASASYTPVPLSCAKHSESEQPSLCSWPGPENPLHQTSSFAVPLHDIHTYRIKLCVTVLKGVGRTEYTF